MKHGQSTDRTRFHSIRKPHVKPGKYPGTKHSKKTINGKRTWK